MSFVPDPNLEPPRIRRTRRSAPRTKSGCFTCKIRRVKCDERRPACRRCEKFGITCDGYPVVPATAPKQVTRLIKPRDFTTLCSGAVPAPVSTTFFGNAAEKNYFDLWHASAPPSAQLLDSAVWTKLIIESCHIPSIRYGVVAVGALGLAFAEAHAQRMRFPTPVSGSEITNDHHKIAVKYFNRALEQMKDDLSSGSQDLRTTLMTCLLIHCFESFHGNYPVAVAQIRTGSELIHEWRSSMPEPNNRFPSPDPTIVEDEIVQTFGSLSIQTFSDPDPRPLPRREALKQEGVEMIRNMPSQFTSIKQARPYLELILKSVTVFLSVTGDHVYMERDSKPSDSPSSTPQSPFFVSQETFSPETISPTSTSPDDQSSRLLTTSTRDNLFQPNEEPPNSISEPAPVYEIDEMKRSENLAKLRQWHSAFKAMPGHRELQNSPSWLLLQLHYKTSVFALSSLSLDPMVYDNYRDAMLEIVILSTRVLEEFEKVGVLFFTPDLGVILPLYLTGMKCRFPSIRKRIINLLLRQSRREGIWDSILAGKIVDWVREVEERFLVQGGNGEEGTVPWWARAEPVNTAFDLQERRASVACFQREGPNDPFPTKREAVLMW